MSHESQPQLPSGPAPRESERGSALIVSMMIMVILTMLGVTFAVLAEQEEKISVNARDHEQTLYAAEAAIEVARTWFNDPSNTTNLFKPTSTQMNYSLRKGRTFTDDWVNADERTAVDSDTNSAVDGSAGAVYTGGNQGGGSSRFDKPFRGTTGNTLWGRPATPDVLLCGDLTLDVDSDGTVDCNATMKQYMDKLNTSLLMGTNLRNAGHSSRDAGTLQIEQIRVYRPPVDFDSKTRYGVATIEATAVKRIGNQIVARRTVREVLQEIPFPGPNGAIESEGEISSAGSQGVHWGSVVSSAINDDILLPGPSNNFPDCSVARQTASRWGFHWTINPAAKSDHGGISDSTTGLNYAPRTTFLTEALGITKNGKAQGVGAAAGSNQFSPAGIPDPWLIFRARRRIIISGNPNNSTQPQPYQWNASSPSAAVRNGPEFDKTVQNNWSHLFQFQIVRFPPMDYQTWKDVSQSASQGMYYFKWDGTGGANSVNYKRDGVGASQSWTTWLSQLQRGVFFFDTKDSTKPTYNTATPPVCTNCTATHGWTTNLYVEGFIYLNSSAFESTGSGGGTTKECNMPGEPFLDDGIDLHATGQTVGDDCLCIRYDQQEGCVLGVRPIGYKVTSGANVDVQTCGGTLNDGDDCVCTQTKLAQMKGSSAQRLIDAREADTFRNGIWDSDINNDGYTDANDDITTYAAWNDFIADNDGAGQGFNGGHGFNKGVLPHYAIGKRYDQGQQTTGNQMDWKRDPRFLNHVTEAGWNPSPAAARKVYEPYLNFDSISTNSTVATWANSHDLTVDYKAQDEPVEKNGATITKRTTRARDATGALIGLDLHINGVFYCEGTYTGSGNLKVFGSLLMRGGFSGTGSVDVWFNENLVKGKFPDASWRLPRVYPSARDTN